MNYKRMIDNARKSGIATEKMMYAGIDNVDGMLCIMKDEHPEEYWRFIRKTHEDIYGCHYDEEFAMYDVSKMHSKDKNGDVMRGEYWTKGEVVAATQGKAFPVGTTDCDKYVAYNAMHHDLCKYFSDADILEAAYLFYFADDDAPDGKIWRYMCSMN